MFQLFIDIRIRIITSMNGSKFIEIAVRNICILPSNIEHYEDPRINNIRKISYGFVMPTICIFGIIGNILNLIVLTRRNMQGTVYVYMRGYTLASLLALIFCIPFTLRVLIHKENGGWTNWFQAFYHVHLELYLGNAFLGLGVMMLLAVTVERHASVCAPGYRHGGRPACGSPNRTVFLLPLATFFLYLPTLFRAEMTTCWSDQVLYYQKQDNYILLQSAAYQVYKVLLELVFKIGPTIVLATMNLRIMLVYRRSCNNRRRRRRCRRHVTKQGERAVSNSFAEERRLMLLLGSTSILFFICISPMVFLNLTLSEDNLSLFSYQIFRALANLLEVSNYSLSFYIYCLFSEDFRKTLFRTVGCFGHLDGTSLSPTPSPTPC